MATLPLEIGELFAKVVLSHELYGQPGGPPVQSAEEWWRSGMPAPDSRTAVHGAPAVDPLGVAPNPVGLTGLTSGIPGDPLDEARDEADRVSRINQEVLGDFRRALGLAPLPTSLPSTATAEVFVGGRIGAVRYEGSPVGKLSGIVFGRAPRIVIANREGRF